jgi:hypothetical protein
MKYLENNILKGDMDKELLTEVEDLSLEMKENNGAANSTGITITIGLLDKANSILTKNLKCGEFFTYSAECLPSKTTCNMKAK